MDAQRRTWAGTGLEERRAARREALLGAGIELLGAEGGAAVSVRAVCRSAALTERYFYESFADRDEFVRAVYEDVGRQARDALVAAVASSGSPQDRAVAAVSTFVELMVDDPARGRVLLLAPLAEPALGGQGLELAPAFVLLVHQQLSPLSDPDERQMTAVGLVGALTSLFIGYLDGTITAPREQFVAHCVALLQAAGQPPGGSRG
ncbi:TetR family transcriptional regulator [Prescottella equi]|uniref:TetR family transcriptional regulator n=1 Tax=Rhodococcus hoagii TaxID=43767 RepID=A0A9Q2UNR8_RHOHA|nr:TetR family transcriptional regulator [Prescottella equi]MCD7051053.1 TetR family transcriptional regulator [Rhodococcus sp. BH2-1]GBF12833.1 DNA-binding transcriptional repressor FabR [Rhodococcus sp. Br-6]AVP69606.1 TetR/AcrR family transcriptional regulator [Prescottella equi]MBM4475382.1 TetR family transcriptional regulator [Prescottella equi]MBM4479720.1 TetR family transcriptional regulator [Prescottella equi]